MRMAWKQLFELHCSTATPKCPTLNLNGESGHVICVDTCVGILRSLDWAKEEIRITEFSSKIPLLTFNPLVPKVNKIEKCNLTVNEL